MPTIESLLKKVKNYFPAVNESRVVKAYDFAAEAHGLQKRASGEPFITHPLNALEILLDFHPDEDTIVAMLLHDVSEDTSRSLRDIEKEFGASVRELVSGMEKLRRVKSYGDEFQIQNLQKMFLAMAKDLRVVLMKLCDRLHNVRTLHFLPVEKQKRIAQETLEIYAPIAARLGIYRLKLALEDTAFRFLDSETHRSIVEQLNDSGHLRGEYIASAREILRKILLEEGLTAEVDARIKGVYSIHRKMERKHKSSVAELFDIFAMRITLPDVQKDGKEFVGHLYAALGVVHNRFTPLAHRFKDYVAVPKVNDYRSLHTTVIGLGPKSHTQPTEIQIKTHGMHDQAEFGVAAHWLYDQSKGASSFLPASMADVPGRHIDWIRGLAQLRREVKSKEEFLEDLHIDIFSDRIFVFTPRGDVRDLPRGATPVDFAYSVHSQIGDRCNLAKVNGAVAPLHHELSSGDVVEIITRKDGSPRQSWLSFVKTNFAKTRIRTFFKEQNREQHIRTGRELVNQFLAKIGKKPLSPSLSLLKEYGGINRAIAERENLLVEVGKGTLMASALVRKLFTLDEILVASHASRQKKSNLSGRVKKVLVAGHPDLPIRMAKCCAPKADEAISAFITRDRGVTIHRNSCALAASFNPARLQKAQWAVSAPSSRDYWVSLIVESADRTGILHDIADIFDSMRVPVEDVHTEERTNGLSRHRVLLKIGSYEQLEQILSKLELAPHVTKSYLA